MKTAALAGTPNAGKTTLFNALTGESQFVGNFPGATVEKKAGRVCAKGGEFLLHDLPGMYALYASSEEEIVSRDYIKSGQADCVICVADIMNPLKGVILAMQIMSLGANVVLALNMGDEFRKRAGKIDLAALSKALGCPVRIISARTRDGLDDLTNAVFEAFQHPQRAKIAFPSDEEGAFAFAEDALRKASYHMEKRESAVHHALDKLFTGRITSFPILVFVVFLIFFLAFGSPGTYASRFIERAFAFLFTHMAHAAAFLPPIIHSFIFDGLLSGVCAVSTFLPQVGILYFALAVIEDTGYMARAAFISDRLFMKLGLSGKSIIPFVLGLGCTTTAVCAAGCADDEQQKRMTVMLTPCISCGAKIPVYALIARMFFPQHASFVILSLYGIGIIALILTGLILKKRFAPASSVPFVMELPPYRLPTWDSVRIKVLDRTKGFLGRAGSVIVLMSAVVWFLSGFSWNLSTAIGIENSIFGTICRFLSPLFRPLGFSTFSAVSALLSGLVAKESIISTFTVLSASEGALSLNAYLPFVFSGSAGAYAFLVFVLLYPPCASATASIRRELKSGRMLLNMLIMQLLFAYLFSYAAYRIGLWLSVSGFC